ncbi:MAG: hypothetical protein QNJ23_11070 [Woeseiaceae bacterium]|nr:hypothetical protein [Woeseiaceae bacterium]
MLTLVIMSAISVPAVAGEAVVKRVPAGAVAFHFVFNLDYVPVVPGPPEFVGYVAYIEGVDSSLFAGTPSKDTAYFTIRVTRGLPPPIDLLVETDPELTVQLIAPDDMFAPGQFTVFYNSSPGPRDWKNPDTFSDGVPVAVFEEGALMSSQAFGTFPGVFFNTFSAQLIDSSVIRFNGQKINFKRIVPFGVTATNFGNAIHQDFSGVSGGGTAVAIGPKFRKAPDDDD